MIQFINGFISGLSTKFYIFQVVTILLLMLYGFLLIYLLRKGETSLFDVLLSFPCALAIYAISGYFLLSFGIPFNKMTVPVLMVLVLSICYFASMSKIHIRITKNTALMCTLIVILALVCTSGIIPVASTNDSMYFFSEYPRALIHYGKLVSYLDNFLTDASQGIAIIGTIPFFYGFDEIYGIMSFLNVNFIVLFGYAAYEVAKEKCDRKTSCTVATLAVIMLITSMPFVIMSHWFMANMFFMEYLFIVVYIAYKYEGTMNHGDIVILSVLITGLSIMRMEGALNAGFIVLCIMMLEYKNKDIAIYMICPMLILQSAYLYRIFRILTLYSGYQFMTEQKAIVLIAFLVVILLYTLIIRNRIFIKIQTYYRWLLVLGFLALNIAVLLYDRSDYITNIKAYIGNVTGNSGWGLFVSLVIGILIIVPKKSVKVNYFDITAVCFIMFTIVVGWARGDTLYVSFGDSGNRILIQVVPLVIFALVIKIMEGLRFWEEEKSDLME